MEEMIWTDDWICIVSKEEKERKLEKLPVREGTLHYRPSEHKIQNGKKYGRNQHHHHIIIILSYCHIMIKSLSS